MATSNFSGAGSGEELSPGIRVGGARYILKRLLGRGEICEVWLVQDVRNSREVALKFLPKAFLSDVNLLERFKEETQRNFLLKHPNIAATYEFVRDHYNAAIATEYVNGWSLAAFKIDKPQQRYRVGEIEPWLRQAGAALKFAHEEFGMVHGDLKPSNLQLDAKEQIKITDFGIARGIHNEGARRGLLKGVAGGIGFLSPQQVMSGEPAKTDDIYSLGATIFDLLTGTPPFYKGEIIAQISGLKPPPMTERLRELKITDAIPPVWEDTVARCLAKNPSERPQSIGEVLELLERKELSKPAEPKVVAKEPIAAPPVEVKVIEPPKPKTPEEIPAAAETPSDITPRPASKRPLVIGAAMVIVVLFLTAGIFAAVKLKHAISNAVAQIVSKTNFPAMTKSGSPGSLDQSFNAGTGADNDIRALAIQSDGKILIGGRFNVFNGENCKGIGRLNSDGTLDGDFKFHAAGSVHAIALGTGSDIFAGGDFASIGGKRHPRIAQLSTDGGAEQNFGRRVAPDLEVRTIAVQGDGEVLFGGSFKKISGNSQNRLARFNANGTLDEAFDSNVNSGAPVWRIAIQPDGKILVGGAFVNFNGEAAGHIVRLNADGSLDSSFNTGSGADHDVIAIAVQSDGSILIGGNFLSVNNMPCSRIARLNPDGTLDTTFAAGAGANGTVRAITIQRDGKILVGGSFTQFSGVPCNHLVRLNADGSLDKTFVTGTGASDAIYAIALEPDGKILIGGTFKAFNGVGCGGIVRLNN